MECRWSHPYFLLNQLYCYRNPENAVDRTSYRTVCKNDAENSVQAKVCNFKVYVHLSGAAVPTFSLSTGVISTLSLPG